MEIVQYVKENEHGSMVVIGTNIHIEAIGFAHEGGYSEQELLKWFNISKEQFYGALAYFYGNRDSIIADETVATELAKELSQKGLKKLGEWRKNQSK